MIDVFVSGPPEEVGLLLLGNGRQDRFRFLETPAPDAVKLTISPDPSACPFSVSRNQGVMTYTFQSDVICGYVQTSKDVYLLICSILGLIQWRVLSLNPLLIGEDFIVDEDPPGCLYAKRATIQEYALAFERPYVCYPCLEFFRCLGAERETLTLQEILNGVTQSR
jgi:hypothetical protein